jgi:hypothetical protein
MTEKFNPDVLDNYKKTLETRPQTSFEATDRIWKAITDSKEIITDKPSTEEIDSRLNEELSKRERERKFVKRKNHIKLDAVEETEEATESRDFSTMKRAIIAENDRLQKEKETYNKFLDELKDLM